MIEGSEACATDVTDIEKVCSKTESESYLFH